LPSSLSESLGEFERDAVLCEGFGDAFVREFLDVKHAECDELMLDISAAEFSRYVDFF